MVEQTEHTPDTNTESPVSRDLSAILEQYATGSLQDRTRLLARLEQHCTADPDFEAALLGEAESRLKGMHESYWDKTEKIWKDDPSAAWLRNFTENLRLIADGSEKPFTPFRTRFGNWEALKSFSTEDLIALHNWARRRANEAQLHADAARRVQSVRDRKGLLIFRTLGFVRDWLSHDPGINHGGDYDAYHGMSSMVRQVLERRPDFDEIKQRGLLKYNLSDDPDDF